MAGVSEMGEKVEILEVAQVNNEPKIINYEQEIENNFNNFICCFWGLFFIGKYCTGCGFSSGI